MCLHCVPPASFLATMLLCGKDTALAPFSETWLLVPAPALSQALPSLGGRSGGVLPTGDCEAEGTHE